jgi:hypothetical protein
MAKQEALRDFLAKVATGVWRLRQRFLEPGSDRPREELRRPYRDVEALWDTLTEAGLEILDHTGKPYEPGESLKVIAFQPAPGLDRERVVETVKPTVYLGGEWLQMGEVIVGTPTNG